MARKDILSTNLTGIVTNPAQGRAPTQKRGAVGALQSSLNKLQESAVQQIDAALIEDAGVEDRLGLDEAAQQQLVESLKTYGQQVPVLLRPHTSKQGRYEIVYGRRRLKALRLLGLPVSAMVRQLDDHALVMAQGQENTSRQDLSFIEKAAFAVQLQELDYDRPTIAAALSMDLPMVSRMLKVGIAFPLPFLRAIGSAPGIGRDRWTALAKALDADGARGRAIALMNTPDFATLQSDARFEAILARATAASKLKSRIAPVKPRTLRAENGAAIADIRSTPKGVTLNISARNGDGFDTWINANAETLLADLHDRWTNERTED
jgi:ParB family chromosome partitioning protein